LAQARPSCGAGAALGSWSDAWRVSAWPGALRALLLSPPTASIRCVLCIWEWPWISTHTCSLQCCTGSTSTRGNSLLQDFESPRESAVSCHAHDVSHAIASQWRPPCSLGLRLSCLIRLRSDATLSVPPPASRGVWNGMDATAGGFAGVEVERAQFLRIRGGGDESPRVLGADADTGAEANANGAGVSGGQEGRRSRRGRKHPGVQPHSLTEAVAYDPPRARDASSQCGDAPMPALSMVLDGSAEMPTGVSPRQPFRLVEASAQPDDHRDGAVERAPSSGPVLHVVGVDGITMDVRLCDARGTVDGPPRQGGLQAANSIFSSEGTPQCTLYPGSCFHAPSIVPSGVSWTSDAMSSYASLSVDTDMLRRLHATFPTLTSAPAAVRA